MSIENFKTVNLYIILKINSYQLTTSTLNKIAIISIRIMLKAVQILKPRLLSQRPPSKQHPNLQQRQKSHPNRLRVLKLQLSYI
jgi:hypothetical protein